MRLIVLISFIILVEGYIVPRFQRASFSSSALRETLLEEEIQIPELLTSSYNRTKPEDDNAFQDTYLQSRRDWLVAGVAAATTATVVAENWKQIKPPKPNTGAKLKRKLSPVNLTQVARETRINITMECRVTCLSLDTNTFQKKETLRLPSWVPWVPPTRVIKDIPNSEVLTAAIIAGSTMEIARTSLLYPLLTLKTRTQTDTKGRGSRLSFKRRLKLVGLTAAKHWKEGNLYAGILPTIFITVPATGVYYGVRDIFKRGVTPLDVNPLYVAIAAAFIADVVMLAFRTPVDALTIRLQAVSGQEAYEEERGDAVAGDDVEVVKVKGWFIESLERLPAVIFTDLPYLLSRTVLNRLFIHGDVGIGYYEFTAIFTGVLCAFLTTPFDVARTRILIDSDDDPSNGLDGGSREGLLQTFRTIYEEGNGGLSNLFAGWFERTLYLGIGRACLEPLMLVGYIALRDYILLQWFD